MRFRRFRSLASLVITIMSFRFFERFPEKSIQVVITSCSGKVQTRRELYWYGVD